MEPVKVNVYELTLLELNGAEARLRAHCSGGTYMRSIAHDLGQALGCGAHLQDLRRLASGEFTLAQALTIAQLEALAAEGTPRIAHLGVKGLPTSGKPEELMNAAGISAKHIVAAATKLIQTR